jgi:hypothetical protein
MRLGDTHVLAEVGVGINLAFATIQSFRAWLLDRVNRDVEAAAAFIEGSISEVPGIPKGGRSVREARNVAQAFKAETVAFENRFIAASIVAVVALISYIASATAYAGVDVPAWAVFPVLVADVGAVGTWGFLLGLRYLDARLDLRQIEHGCRDGVAFIKKELEAKVEPTDPSTSMRPSRIRRRWTRVFIGVATCLAAGALYYWHADLAVLLSGAR